MDNYQASDLNTFIISIILIGIIGLYVLGFFVLKAFLKSMQSTTDDECGKKKKRIFDTLSKLKEDIEQTV